MKWYYIVAGIVAFVAVCVYGYVTEKQEQVNASAAKARQAKADKRISGVIDSNDVTELKEAINAENNSL